MEIRKILLINHITAFVIAMLCSIPYIQCACVQLNIQCIHIPACKLLCSFSRAHTSSLISCAPPKIYINMLYLKCIHVKTTQYNKRGNTNKVTHLTTTPETKRKELSWVGFEYTTLWSLDQGLRKQNLIGQAIKVATNQATPTNI